MSETEQVQLIVDKATELTKEGLLTWYRAGQTNEQNYYCQLDGAGTLKIEVGYDRADGSFVEITDTPPSKNVEVVATKISIHKLIAQIEDVCFGKSAMLAGALTRMNEKLAEAKQ